jgi:hypothetical protein
MVTPFPKPLPVLPQGWLVRLYGTNTGSNTPSTNQIAFISAAIKTPALAGQIATAIGGHWASFVAASLHTDYVGVQVGCYDLSVANSVEVFEPMVASGNVASVPAPPNIGFDIKHSVGVRHKTGHTRVSPVSNAFINAGTSQMVSVDRVTVQTAWDTFIDGSVADAVWGGAATQYALLSYQTNKVSDPRLIPVISSLVQLNLASIRRRRGY